MKVETWRNGLNITIENVVQLYNDGKLLMENESYGHACFSFITAFEEMGVAYFILSHFNNPEPKKLEKFFNHAKKIAISNIASLLFTAEHFGNVKKLYEAWIKDTEKDIKIHQSGKSESFKVAQDMGKQESLWYLRNHGIYIMLNNSKTDFQSPTNIGKEHTEKLKEKLKNVLPFLQAERDIYMKFGVPDNLTVNAIENFFELRSKLEELSTALRDGSLEKINKLQNISPTLKDFCINILLDKYPIKHEELNLEMDSLFGEQNSLNMMIIILYEIIKNFIEQFRSLVKAGRPDEVKNYWIERMKIYSPEDSAIREFILPFLDIMVKEDPDPKEVIKLFQSKMKQN